MKNIAVLVGSLRERAYSRILGEQLIAQLPEGFHASIVEIGDLDLYNEDLDTEENLPESWARFRHEMASKDAVIFVTPEYNRTIPAAMKNAVDVGSRPYGSSIWTSKPALVVSHSQGHMGGYGANQHLRQSLSFFNMPTVQQPEAYIGDIASLVDQDGKISNEETLDFLDRLIQAFIHVIEIHN